LATLTGELDDSFFWEFAIVVREMARRATMIADGIILLVEHHVMRR
jgi:hypothetical protein